MIEAEKSENDLIGQAAQGYRGDFMALHDGRGVHYPVLPLKPLAILEERDFRAPIVQDSNFGFFLQLHLPEARYHTYRHHVSGEKSYAVKDKERIVHFTSQSIKGDVSLWEEIRHLDQYFEQMGRPACSQFRLRIDAHGTISSSYRLR